MSPISVKQQLLTALTPRSKLWGGSATPTSSTVSVPHPQSQSVYQRRLAGKLNDGHTSPFDKIPFELFVEIFSHCPNDFPRIDALVAPVTLALVCHTWYDLVMKTPRLWSCFEVVLEGIGTVESEMIAVQRNLNAWLKRSCTQPLSFRIVHKSTGRAYSDQRAVELFNILLPHANRWQDVQFHGPGDSLVNLPLKLQTQQTSLPLLTSLSVRLSRSQLDSRLDFSQFNIPWFQITRLDLQFYEEHLHSLNECYTVLSAARNLVSCTLNANCIFSVNGDGDSDSAMAIMKKLALPSLKSLHLILQSDGDGGGHITQANGTGLSTLSPEKSLVTFLERLDLRDMTKFNVEWLVDHIGHAEDNAEPNAQQLPWDRTEIDDVYPRFVTFIHSFSHSIQSLGLSYFPWTDQKLIGCLRGLDNLVELDLKFSLNAHSSSRLRGFDPITEDFWNWIMPSTNSPFSLHLHRHKPHWRSGFSGSGGGGGYDQMQTLVPMALLRTLKVQCSGEKFDSGLLVEVLEGRTQVNNGVGNGVGVEGLKEFGLVTMKSMPWEFHEQLLRWRNEGRDFKALNVGSR